MATIDWPSTPECRPSAVRIGVSTPRSSWRAFYTGQRQSVAHLADRLRVTMWLPAAFGDVQSARREALLVLLSSRGDWVRLGHFRRPVPLGSARGTMTLYASAAAGARTITLQGMTPAGTGTLLAGDMLGIGGNLLMVASDVTADGSGRATLTLATPILAASAAGAAVTWAQPTGQFELTGDEPMVEYSQAGLQAALELHFSQVLP